MGLVERLNELSLMRQNGQLSDSEYALLVESATKNFKENEIANSVASETDSELSKKSSHSKTLAKDPWLIGVGVLVFLAIALLASNQGGARGGSVEEKCFEYSQKDGEAFLLILMLSLIWPVLKFKVGKKFKPALIVVIISSAVLFGWINRIWDGGEAGYDNCIAAYIRDGRLP